MTTKVYDAFNGTAGTDISAHTPDIDIVGGGWTDGGANTFELDGSGGLQYSAANDNCRIDNGVADQWATVPFNAGGADNRVFIELRRNNAAHGSHDCYRFNYRPGDTGAELHIYRTVSGSNTLLTNGPFTNSLSTTYSLEPEVNGTALDFKIDGVSKLSTTDAVITAGSYAGLSTGLRSSATARFYSFLIDDGVISGQVDVTGPIGQVDAIGSAEFVGQVDVTGPIGQVDAVGTVTGGFISGQVDVTGPIGQVDAQGQEKIYGTVDVIGPIGQVQASDIIQSPVNVIVRLKKSDGTGLAGASVKAELQGLDLDDGFVTEQGTTEALTDINGEATLSLWPTLRGVFNRSYRITAYHPVTDNLILDVTTPINQAGYLDNIMVA